MEGLRRSAKYLMPLLAVCMFVPVLVKFAQSLMG